MYSISGKFYVTLCWVLGGLCWEWKWIYGRFYGDNWSFLNFLMDFGIYWGNTQAMGYI